MAERTDGQLTRTVARCDTCGSFHVVKISADGSVCLEGLAECPCGDGELTLYGPSPGGGDL